jgi:hypothetical protein
MECAQPYKEWIRAAVSGQVGRRVLCTQLFSLEIDRLQSRYNIQARNSKARAMLKTMEGETHIWGSVGHRKGSQLVFTECQYLLKILTCPWTLRNMLLSLSSPAPCPCFFILVCLPSCFTCNLAEVWPPMV